MLFTRNTIPNIANQLSIKIAAIFLIAAIMPFKASLANSPVNVFACEPEWAALSVEVGGEHVSVFSATTALQDPHHIQARPKLIAQTRKADLLICSGAELEVGWLPVLLNKSGNSKLQPHSDGHFMATDVVELLGKIENVTSDMGHVHAAGNPHIHLDPNRVKSVARELARKLSKIDPDNSLAYKRNYLRLETSIDEMLVKNQSLIDSLKGKKWIVHHDNWIYLNNWLGLEQVATLEPKPGVPPTTKHLSGLVRTVESTAVDAVAFGSYQSPKAAKWLSKRTQLPIIAVPYSIINWQEKGAVVNWYNELLNTLNTGLNN